MMNKSKFRKKKILLLQGPVGPFFKNLSKDLTKAGAEVLKYNFNAGDWIFYPKNSISYTGKIDFWLPELKKFIIENKVDAVLLFGDCRPVHLGVRQMGQKMGFAVGVFEEGYLRPDFVTFEPIGVNGYSKFHSTFESWLNMIVDENNVHDECEEVKDFSRKIFTVGRTYWYGALWGMIYFLAAWIGQWFWNNKLHHRKLTIADAPWWWLSYGRKAWYRFKERNITKILLEDGGKPFFLVPLQVYNDAQMTVHSDYESVCDFIDQVMNSFSSALRKSSAIQKNVPIGFDSLRDNFLVLKHHPMDRGHRDYSHVIRLLTKRHGLEGRVLYIHDQHLPSLLKRTKGVVLVNSTTGLSALGHGAPVKVCGSALYDMPGLTFQGALRDFWFAAGSARPDPRVLSRFKRALMEQTQLNGSFYKKLASSRWHCGVMLQGQMAERLWPEYRSTHVDRSNELPENKIALRQ